MSYYLETPNGERKPISESTYLYAVKVRNFFHVLRDERVTIIKGTL